MLVTASM